MEFQRPSSLKTGDTVAIVSPSSGMPHLSILTTDNEMSYLILNHSCPLFGSQLEPAKLC